ncbi:uncharacterized protein DFL_006291 [Arthrobotrys flagrans]|uniref:Uncharacterized protein n=1 Tax=Arthrobotrys flagrans TaxID=97331 RepID=A0A437A0J3_ARTFL|nr:hypothetical protein DFL_006291 [Arthrobotrys flagrans]
MEVNHEAMNNAGSAITPASARPTETSNAMEHDPSSAPQIVDPSNPPMSFRSGAVPDHYESYPEVMPPQGLGPPSAYPQSAQTISPVQPGGSYDRYAISPNPAGQNQPLMQNAQHGQAPMGTEAEKSYYQPTYGVSQPLPPPTPYSNANTLVPDQHTTAPYDKVGGAGATLPPPVAYNPPSSDGEKKILGMKKKTFWIVLIVLIILILAGIGGAVGGVLASKNKDNDKNDNNDSLGSDRGNGTRGGNGDDGNGGAYTPFALTTGQRTLELKYSENRGSCNDPQHLGGTGVIDCYAESTYVVRIDGSVANGYTLSSVDVQGSTFSNIRGIPPTTSDPNEVGSGWVFEVSFTQGGSCGTNRVTKYVFGVEDNIYAIGEAFSLQQQCSKVTGESYPAGTSCTCVAISKTVE